ncbi:nuclear transport factor 2 family protein [Curtobacterium sp. ISL-83]|uniref:nuclear transport factor 2 family protein n=1 Tax=Curtobacterium sp. ISL-83 TaxID=2819145 RepID=UPI001BE558F4|nr:nuclear transport factor 2 family protein [Curtobacterium sp. ISL-83]MBT2501715.1 nuclear transport factor 2 family protein [Curtobacterium sp. ISL-83]
MLTSTETRDAESAITRLIYTYCHRLDGADLAGAAALFEHARWQLSPDVICQGSAEHLDALQVIRVYGDRLGTRHVVSNLLIDIAEDGLSAKSVSYVDSIQVTAEFPLQLIFQGRYLDTFVFENGAWRFDERIVDADGAGDMSAHHKA